MKKQIFIICFVVAGYAAISILNARTEKMHEVKIDIGKNISDTAENSGATQFGIEDHWGLKIYELVNLRSDVTILFSRPGLEITSSPLFSLTMYADSENKNNMAVEKIELKYNYKARSHEEAQEFTEIILAQFRRGKWKRFISETCPSITGRSTYLDKNGKIDHDCPLDPGYRIPIIDWIQLMSLGRSYQWMGDGVLAILNVNFDQDTRGLTYNIDLEFNDHALLQRHMDTEQARKLIEGDQKGWKSTEEYNKGMAETKAMIKVLEENAVRRGDRLVQRK